MDCECSQLPKIFNIETYPNSLMDCVELTEQKGSWLKLYKCLRCGQHWQIDAIDKLQVNCAIKINNPKEWKSFDDKPIRVQYLIDSRGGLSEEQCLMQDCKNKTLISLAYCPKHAYETLGIRQ